MRPKRSPTRGRRSNSRERDVNMIQPEDIKREPEEIWLDDGKDCIQTVRIEIPPDKNEFTPEKCLRCDETVGSFVELLQHANRKHCNELFCHLCPADDFTLVIDVLNHLKFKHNIGENSDELLVCLKSQLKSRDMQMRSTPTRSKMEKETSANSNCLLCHQHVSLLGSHVNTEHNYCRSCSVSFSKYSDLIRHQFKHAAGQILRYRCSTCWLEFKHHRTLTKHSALTHINEELKFTLEVLPQQEDPNGCPYCNVQADPSHSAYHSVSDCRLCKNSFVNYLNDSTGLCSICDVATTKLTIPGHTNPGVSKKRVLKTDSSSKSRPQAESKKQKEKTEDMEIEFRSYKELMAAVRRKERAEKKARKAKKLKEKASKEAVKRKPPASAKIPYKQRIAEIEQKNAINLLTEIPRFNIPREVIPKVIEKVPEVITILDKPRLPYTKRMAAILGSELASSMLQKPRYIAKCDEANKAIFHGIPCIFCTEFKGANLDVYRHTREVHNMCRVCLIEFKSEQDYRAHKARHKRGLVHFYNCVHCGVYLKSALEYRRHLDKGHPHINRQIVRCQTVERKIPDLDLDRMATNSQCPFCRTLLALQTFMDHLKVKHQICCCTRCNENFVGKSMEEQLCQNCQNPQVKCEPPSAVFIKTEC